MCPRTAFVRLVPLMVYVIWPPLTVNVAVPVAVVVTAGTSLAPVRVAVKLVASPEVPLLSSPQDRTSGNRAARTTFGIVKRFIPPPFIGWSLGASSDTLGGQVQPVLYRDSLLGAV